MNAYEGGCACGAVGLLYTPTAVPRATRCPCGYCAMHDAKWAGKAGERVVFRFDEADVSRYRFGSGTADWLSCRRCGVALGALLAHAPLTAIVNLRAFESLREIDAPIDAFWEGETREETLARRRTSWIGDVTVERSDRADAR